MASSKVLSPSQVAKKYRIPADHGKAYVETDICSKRIDMKKNPLYGSEEVTVRGPTILENPTIILQP